jgi:hypothetical protein
MSVRSNSALCEKRRPRPSFLTSGPWAGFRAFVLRAVEENEAREGDAARISEAAREKLLVLAAALLAAAEEPLWWSRAPAGVVDRREG